MSVPEEVGTRNAADAWLKQLRERFVSITRRRVAPDAVEDIVQDAMRVVIERGLSGPGSMETGEPALAWCFQVLRNVIGNHYQKERVRQRRTGPDVDDLDPHDPAPAPLEALASDEALRVVGDCLAEMAASDAGCARYLRRLVEGLAPRDLAREEDVTEAVLYRRVYRCRLKLRERLERRGYFA